MQFEEAGRLGIRVGRKEPDRPRPAEARRGMHPALLGHLSRRYCVVIFKENGRDRVSVLH